MHLSVQTPLEADVARVAQLLADPAFVQAKVLAAGASAETVDVVGHAAESFTVTTRRSVPMDEIPAQFRGFIGSSLQVRQVEAWERPVEGRVGRHGTVAVEVAGVPVRLTGTVRLEPTDTGSVLRYDGDLRAGIPLFGAAVEEATAKAVRSALDAEARTAREWLSREA